MNTIKIVQKEYKGSDSTSLITFCRKSAQIEFASNIAKDACNIARVARDQGNVGNEESEMLSVILRGGFCYCEE